ncbi:NADAR family protein, partial [Acinetobacter baumannii]|uniref:NADAR family protein n=1 Tax=Acinetobacter baumannii TaxID=470 RepID=UPI00105A2A58
MNKIDEFRGKYYFLSNFYNSPVTYEGITCQNNEAAFQAMKVTTDEIRKQFADLPPNLAKRKGRNVQLRNDWEEVKEQYMYEIVLAKFKQNR